MAVWLETEFLRKKDLVRKTIQSAISSIHISTDLWTSPNNLLIQAVCGHFVATNEKQYTILLAVRETEGYSGEQQFNSAIYPVLQEYQIEQNLGTLIGDNSGTNDTLSRTISSFLRQKFPQQQE